MKVWKIQKYFPVWTVLSICILLMAGCQASPATSPAADGEPATYRMDIDLLDARHEVLVDAQGKIKEKVELSSADGEVSLSLKKGTTVTDKEGKPLELIQVSTDSSLPLPPEDAYIIGEVYDLKPERATFDPPLMFTISYDPNELPEGVRESEVYIAPYDGSSGWGRWSYKNVDADNNRVTAQISSLGRVAVLAPLPPKTTPAAPAQPSRTVSLKEALSNGKPTLAEFGASTCVPCKQMKPILEQLAIEYEGKLNVAIVEVYDQMELTMSYQIMTIPTQVVFDSNGKEINQHIGLWPKEQIIAQLKQMGVE